jgi:F-type H+-transporting ATPase subunit b
VTKPTTTKPAKQAKHDATAAPVEGVEAKETQAETAHVETPSPLANEYVWIGLAFTLTVVGIIKFLLPMINKGLDGRAAKIRDQLEQATRLREEAQQLLVQYQREQEEKLKEAEATIAAAKRDAAELRARAAEDLKQALERRSQQAHEKIVRAEAEAVSQIRAQIIENATQMARIIVADRLKGQSDDQAVARAIASIELQVH